MSHIGVYVGGLDEPILGRVLASIQGQPDFHVVPFGELRDFPAVAVIDESAGYSELNYWKTAASGVVVLADGPSEMFGSLLLNVGVSCLAKDAVPELAATVIRMSASGEIVFKETGAHSLAGLLSPRQIEVYELLRTGRKPAAIAVSLKITVATARTHCQNVRLKVGARSNREISGMAPLQTPRAPNADI